MGGSAKVANRDLLTKAMYDELEAKGTSKQVCRGIPTINIVSICSYAVFLNEFMTVFGAGGGGGLTH